MPSVHLVADAGRRVLHPPADAPWWHRAPAFVAVGVSWTLLYLLMYAALRGLIGAQLANAIALVLTTVGSTDSHRVLTFTVRDRSRGLHLAHQALGLTLLLAGLAITSGSLSLLATLDPTASALTELAVLIVANGLSGALRFGVFALAMRQRDGGPTPALV